MSGFFQFVRKQGVVGLAIGFVLGGAAQKLVSALVDDIVNPLVGIIIGRAGTLSEYAVSFGGVTLKWGDFASHFIDFLTMCFVVYIGYKWLRLDRIDLKKE